MEKDRRTRGCRGRSILDFGWTRSKTLSFRSPSIATVFPTQLCVQMVFYGAVSWESSCKSVIKV